MTTVEHSFSKNYDLSLFTKAPFNYPRFIESVWDNYTIHVLGKEKGFWVRSTTIKAHVVGSDSVDVLLTEYSNCKPTHSVFSVNENRPKLTIYYELGE